MVRASAGSLRRELSVRNMERSSSFLHEQTYGRSATVVYAEDENGVHGNFLAASYRRIVAKPEWRKRLGKAYSGSAWIAHAGDRRRGELECCASSDALLMNVFCYPRVLARTSIRSLLGLPPGTRAEFGVRAGLAMHRGETDRTEVDLRLGSLLVESKLSESGFGVASRERLHRYVDLGTVFDTEALKWTGRGVAGYQLVRGALAAFQTDGRYMLLWDERRIDLREQWFQVLGALHSSEVRSRMLLLSWQELATALPGSVRLFLASKYGIVAKPHLHGR